MSLIPSWAPNIHPLVIHFPIVLLIAAAVMDLVDALFERPAWLGAAASSLYVAGAASAVAAVLTGIQAGSTVLLPGMAHPQVSDHRSWALITTLYMALAVVIRLAARRTGSPRTRTHRLLLLTVGLIGVVLVQQTAERGARLVYEHGVGVIGAPLSNAQPQGDAAGASIVRTIEPGVLTVAVTTMAPAGPYDSQQWIRSYVERFAADHGLTIRWVVVPFDQSWWFASRHEVDLVATNVASFPDRKSPGATFSAPFLYERRALRIRPQDKGRYSHIDDFVGKTVGVVQGMAAERDVRRRAKAEVIVVTTKSFAELYDQFAKDGLDAIAEAEYYALDGRVIPSHGDDVVMVDLHDLTPGQREESVFVVSDRSTGLLTAIDAFIAKTRFPL